MYDFSRGFFSVLVALWRFLFLNLYFRSLPFYRIFIHIYLFIYISCSVSYISQRMQLKQVENTKGGVEDFNSKIFT